MWEGAAPRRTGRARGVTHPRHPEGRLGAWLPAAAGVGAGAPVSCFDSAPRSALGASGGCSHPPLPVAFCRVTAHLGTGEGPGD